MARYPRKWDKSKNDKHFGKMRHFWSSFAMCGGVAADAPNIGLQATANSLRSFLAPAIGGA